MARGLRALRLIDRQILEATMTAPLVSDGVICHYCGYDPRPARTKNNRKIDKPRACPKCGGSSWEQREAVAPSPTRIWLDAHPNPEEPETVSSGQRPRDHNVNLEFDADAQQVYVAAARPNNPRFKIFPMRRVDSSHWRLSMHFEPGVYRYHYFVDDGEHLVERSPDAEKSSAKLDATLVVPETPVHPRFSSVPQPGDRATIDVDDD